MARKEKSPAELALAEGRLTFDGESGTLVLAVPIKHRVLGADQKVSEELVELITVREALAGDLEILDTEDGQVGGGLAIIAHLSGYPKKTLKGLRGRDFAVLSEVCSGFTPPGPETGDRSSG